MYRGEPRSGRTPSSPITYVGGLSRVKSWEKAWGREIGLFVFLGHPRAGDLGHEVGSRIRTANVFRRDAFGIDHFLVRSSLVFPGQCYALLEQAQKIMQAAEKPRADLSNVLRIDKLIAFLVAPRIRPGFVDLDLELVLPPFLGRRRGLLLFRLLLLSGLLA